MTRQRRIAAAKAALKNPADYGIFVVLPGSRMEGVIRELVLRTVILEGGHLKAVAYRLGIGRKALASLFQAAIDGKADREERN